MCFTRLDRPSVVCVSVTRLSARRCRWNGWWNSEILSIVRSLGVTGLFGGIEFVSTVALWLHGFLSRICGSFLRQKRYEFTLISSVYSALCGIVHIYRFFSIYFSWKISKTFYTSLHFSTKNRPLCEPNRAQRCPSQSRPHHSIFHQ